MLQADAPKGLFFCRQIRIPGTAGVDGEKLLHFFRRGHTGQRGVGGVHQLPEGAEKAVGEHQRHQRGGERNTSRSQLTKGSDSSQHHAAVDHAVREQEGSEIHPHHIHDFVVEPVRLVLQHFRPAFILMEQLQGGQTLDAFQVIAGEILHGLPVIRLQRFNVLPEQIVGGKQDQRHCQQHQSGGQRTVL